jgi:hypothetical protein
MPKPEPEDKIARALEHCFQTEQDEETVNATDGLLALARVLETGIAAYATNITDAIRDLAQAIRESKTTP